MSIDAMKLVWEHSKQTATPRLVMLALADNANSDGFAWPGFKTIAEMCNCSERQVSRIVAELEAAGELYVERGVGRKNYTRYLLTLNVTADQLSRRMVQYLDYSPAEAVAAAAAHVTKKDDISGEKQTTMSPFSAKEKVTSGTEKVTSEARKGDILSGKGDIAMSSDPMIQLDPPRSAPRAQAPVPATTPQPAAAAASPSEYQAVVKCYQNEIGMLTPLIEEEIKAELKRSSPDWVIRAIGVAVRRNSRRWAYIAGILNRWHVEGFDGGIDNLSARAGNAAKGGSKSAGYGRYMAPAVSTKGQSIEDYADDPEYYAQLKAIYDGSSSPAHLAAD
jgi:DnaD/phage-associated family protein